MNVLGAFHRTVDCNYEHSEKFSRSLEQFFLTVGQNNFGNKIPYKKLAIDELITLKKKITQKTCTYLKIEDCN